MRGTAKKTRQQIQDELDRLKARVNVGGSATQATRYHRDDARQPARGAAAGRPKCCASPRSRRSEFEQLKQEQLAFIEQQKSEPTQVAVHRVQPAPRPVSEGDVRYTRTPDEQIADVTAATLDAGPRSSIAISTAPRTGS